jgi:hypothetical protein
MRQLSDVINKIIECVPKNEDKIIVGLKDIKSSVMYASPEIQYFWWNELALFLENELGDPKNVKWKLKIVKLLGGNDVS